MRDTGATLRILRVAQDRLADAEELLVDVSGLLSLAARFVEEDVSPGAPAAETAPDDGLSV